MSVATNFIQKEIKKAKDSFKFWAQNSDGDLDTFSGKLASEYLQKQITLELLLKDIKAEEAKVGK